MVQAEGAPSAARSVACPITGAIDIHEACEDTMLGRWVRSPSKYDNWEAYMEWFGMDEKMVRDETIEPQIHVFTAFSKQSMTILHILPERDGLQVEYTIPIDGKQYPIPPIMVKNARSSWKANATWAHSWDERGLRTFQVLKMPKGDFNLRYWRSMVSETEIKISVELSDVETDTLQVATNRYFHKQPYLAKWTAACAQFFSGKDVPANIDLCAGYIAQASAAGASLIVLPENSNRERDYFAGGKPSKELAYERCEAIDGEFITAIRAVAAEHSIWVAMGVDMRGVDESGNQCVHIAQLLIGRDGFVHGVHKKHVLWDYEYTLFEPAAAGDPYRVYDTELGRIGLLVCADGIVPECARVAGCMGAQVLVNSLNSRGPDELRMHIPCRAMENGCWHISSNSVGNPNTVGLLWPWTGGSQIVAPDGARVATASESEADMVLGEIEVQPWRDGTSDAATADRPICGIDAIKSRRPRLYGLLTVPLDQVPAASMYGPAADELPCPVGADPADAVADSCNVALMQLSKYHSTDMTIWCALKQVAYAKKRGSHLGVLPSLFCFGPDEVAADPAAAAAFSADVLAQLSAAAKTHGVWLACTLVEEEAGKYFHTGYVVSGSSGETVFKYRKAHLSNEEKCWASAGDSLSALCYTPWGAWAMMIGEEVWIPEVSRCLALAGAELVIHPTSWRSIEEATVVAVERVSENRFNLVSCSRLDSAGAAGSQVCYAGEFMGDEPIALMRYPTAMQGRHGVEEQLHFTVHRREAHCKMMGFHLDVLHKRYPECYHVLTAEAGSADQPEADENGFWWVR